MILWHVYYYLIEISIKTLHVRNMCPHTMSIFCGVGVVSAIATV